MPSSSSRATHKVPHISHSASCGWFRNVQTRQLQASASEGGAAEASAAAGARCAAPEAPAGCRGSAAKTLGSMAESMLS